jgi:hypothetical protein
VSVLRGGKMLPNSNRNPLRSKFKGLYTYSPGTLHMYFVVHVVVGGDVPTRVWRFTLCFAYVPFLVRGLDGNTTVLYAKTNGGVGGEYRVNNTAEGEIRMWRYYYSGVEDVKTCSTERSANLVGYTHTRFHSHQLLHLSPAHFHRGFGRVQ